MTTIYGTALYGEYEPLAQHIEQVSKETNRTKAAVIRDALCDFYGFIPGTPLRSYKRRVE